MIDCGGGREDNGKGVEGEVGKGEDGVEHRREMTDWNLEKTKMSVQLNHCSQSPIPVTSFFQSHRLHITT
jgi:hypothetical protein